MDLADILVELVILQDLPGSALYQQPPRIHQLVDLKKLYRIFKISARRKSITFFLFIKKKLSAVIKREAVQLKWKSVELHTKWLLAPGSVLSWQCAV